ncbi:MAG: KUP/HAK/KT family potassium transporter [Chitinophagales bacterium]
MSWTFVKIALLLSYFGQAAFIIGNKDFDFQAVAPFYAVMPAWFLKVGIVVATMATIIASQALISVVLLW